MAPTICLTDHNGTTAADTSCPRSRLKPDRVNIARRKRMGVNQSPSLATSIYSPSIKCSSITLADNPTHSHIPEATLPDGQSLKPKIIYKDLTKLCELVARTKSLALRNYILEIMLNSMQRSVQNLPQSTLNKPKSKNDIQDLSTQKLDTITLSINHVEDMEEKLSCSDSNRTESTTD